MSRLMCLGLVASFLLLPPGAFLMGGWRSKALADFDISHPPDALADSIVEELEPRVLRAIQPDAYLLRQITRADGAPSSVYMGFYSGYGATGAHDPTVCFPSQGWDLSQVGYTDVPIQNGESLVVEVFRASQGNRQSLVLYWFQPAGRWSRDYPAENFLRIYDAVSGRKQYAFVRLTTPLTEESGSDSAREILVALARDLAPWVRRVVEGKSTGSRSDLRPSRYLSAPLVTLLAAL